MSLVNKIDRVEAHLIDFPLGLSMLAIAAVGEVNTTGWTHPRLSPYFYVRPPQDGIWDFDFIADAPTGIVAEVVMPTGAAFLGAAPAWCKGVRIHAASNVLEDKVRVGAKVGRSTGPAVAALKVRPGPAIVSQQVASYDDSFQPTGTIHWHNDGPFGLPAPHAEMKKLRHQLVLTVKGPDEGKIRECLNKAIAAGAIAAIVAAVTTGGLALHAAISAALATLEACLGATFSVRMDDQSHWIYWDT